MRRSSEGPHPQSKIAPRAGRKTDAQLHILHF
jgi:hypothetical protein